MQCASQEPAPVLFCQLPSFHPRVISPSGSSASPADPAEHICPLVAVCLTQPCCFVGSFRLTEAFQLFLPPTQAWTDCPCPSSSRKLPERGRKHLKGTAVLHERVSCILMPAECHTTLQGSDHTLARDKAQEEAARSEGWKVAAEQECGQISPANLHNLADAGAPCKAWTRNLAG